MRLVSTVSQMCTSVPSLHCVHIMNNYIMCGNNYEGIHHVYSLLFKKLYVYLYKLYIYGRATVNGNSMTHIIPVCTLYSSI